MNRLLVLFVLALCSSFSYGQGLLDPVSWEVSIQTQENNQFDVVIDAEIEAGYSKPRYPDEMGKLDGWITTLRSRCLGGSMMYPATGRCCCADLFYAHAPEVIRKLHRA